MPIGSETKKDPLSTTAKIVKLALTPVHESARILFPGINEQITNPENATIDELINASMQFQNLMEEMKKYLNEHWQDFMAHDEVKKAIEENSGDEELVKRKMTNAISNFSRGVLNDLRAALAKKSA